MNNWELTELISFKSSLNFDKYICLYNLLNKSSKRQLLKDALCDLTNNIKLPGKWTDVPSSSFSHKATITIAKNKKAITWINKGDIDNYYLQVQITARQGIGHTGLLFNTQQVNGQIKSLYLGIDSKHVRANDRASITYGKVIGSTYTPITTKSSGFKGLVDGNVKLIVMKAGTNIKVFYDDTNTLITEIKTAPTGFQIGSIGLYSYNVKATFTNLYVKKNWFNLLDTSYIWTVSQGTWDITSVKGAFISKSAGVTYVDSKKLKLSNANLWKKYQIQVEMINIIGEGKFGFFIHGNNFDSVNWAKLYDGYYYYIEITGGNYYIKFTQVRNGQEIKVRAKQQISNPINTGSTLYAAVDRTSISIKYNGVSVSLSAADLRYDEIMGNIALKTEGSITGVYKSVIMNMDELSTFIQASDLDCWTGSSAVAFEGFNDGINDVDELNNLYVDKVSDINKVYFNIIIGLMLGVFVLANGIICFCGCKANKKY